MPGPSDTLGYQGRKPPQNLEAEMGVIASVCLMPDIIDELVELKSEHFYADRHQRIWEALLTLRAKCKPLDVVTLAEELDRRKTLEEIGGCEYLGRVLESVPNAAHAVYYAEIVKDRWFHRTLVYHCSEVLQSIYDGTESEDVKRNVERLLGTTLDNAMTNKPVAIREIMVESWNRIQSRLAKHEASGTATGFYDLDQLIVGLEGGELIIVAARPSMGKTAWAVCLMHGLAKRSIGTLCLSCEMASAEVGERLLCLESGVSGSKLKAGGPLEEFESEALMMAASRISEMPIYLEDSPGQKVRDIVAKARLMKRKHNIGLVLVDYLQLVEPNEAKSVREQEVASITKAFKGLTKELGIPVVVLAQLNRGIEGREDKRPRLGDLRESGAIEQDADKVFFLHRPAAYDPADRPGECDLIVAKNRCGKIGTVTLAWLAETTQFRDMAAKHNAVAEIAARSFPHRDWN